MTGLPTSLEEATLQAKEATRAAMQDGLVRLQVELVIPELKIMPIAEQFYPLFQELGWQFKVYFPDAGAAALAKRDWGKPEFTIRGLSEPQGTPEPDDEAFLVIEPSSVEVSQVEALVEKATGRPVVLLNPRLEDIATIGIGYAGRQLRERFLSTLDSCYYLRPAEGATLFRCYPQPWQVWKETSEDQYELLAEFATKPSGEAVDNLLMGEAEDGEAVTPAPRRKGFLSELQNMVRALTQ